MNKSATKKAVKSAPAKAAKKAAKNPPSEVAKRGAKSPPPDVVVPALEFMYNEHRLYLAVVSARRLHELAAVSRAHEDPKAGYQRHLEPTRVGRIADYLNEGNVIPGSIILSAREGEQLGYDAIAKTLTFSARPGLFLVIDGQHRLAGAAAAEADVLMPVCVIPGLDHASEVQYFLDVNGNQRGVPRTLQLEIVKFLSEDGSDDDLRVKLFNALNTNPESPLVGKMSPHKSVLGKLSHVPFKGALDPILGLPPLVSYPFEKKVKLLINFLSAVEKTLIESTGKADKLTNAAFFQALFGAFRDIALITEGRHGNLKEESLLKTMKPIATIDWSQHTGTNRQAIGELTKTLVGLVNQPGRVSDDML